MSRTLTFLFVVCCIFFVRESQAFLDVRHIQNYEDQGVFTFKPVRVFTNTTETRRRLSSSSHYTTTRNVRHVVRYASANGYVYEVENYTAKSAQELKAAGPVQRRVLTNPEQKTFITIDGNLTQEEYVYEEIMRHLKKTCYWMVTCVVLLCGALFYRKKIKNLNAA